MSRINRPPVLPGDPASAAQLNAAYSDFSQLGAVDQLNTRDSAFDLAHFQAPATGNGPVVIRSDSANVGTGDIYHSASPVAPASIAAPPTKTVVSGVLSYGANGQVLADGQVLRVYFNLAVRPKYTGTGGSPNIYPWDSVGALGKYDVPVNSGGPPPNIFISDNAHFWLVQLEWDITSGALINWVPVDGAGNFNGVVVAGRSGQSLQTMRGCACVPAWNLTYNRWRDGGVPGTTPTILDRRIGWTSASSGYVLLKNPLTSRTIYGLRLVIHGIYHPYRDANTNYAVLDVNLVAGGNSAELEYDQGNITAIFMREQ